MTKWAWQLIETAPKDGNIILLGGGTWGDDELEEKPRVMSARWYQHLSGTWAIGCWIVCSAEAGCSIFEYKNPTHWMPSPEQPEIEKAFGYD